MNQAHSPSFSAAQLLRLARERFGVRTFRPGQLELIQAVMAGKDALGILPTGAGKSLTYQLPALLLPGPVVVVSPLISLMQDQQEKLATHDIASARINSTLRAVEERETIEEIKRGEQALIYITPERLENPAYLDLLKRHPVSLFVVDEAHCVSSWGHDFRPSYLSLRDAVRELGRPPVLALTATATADVIEDIQKQLKMESARVVHTGIERKNLHFEVKRTPGLAQKRELLLRLLQDEPGIGIVYVATVKLANELHEWLCREGVAAGVYHGKLKTSEREETQRRFMNDELKVMIATNAFGLGIDKPDIRFVVHFNFPDSLESYYQEAGRSGRDGKRARVVLFYRLEDRRLQAFFLGGKYPRHDESVRFVEVLRSLPAARERSGVRLSEVSTLADISERRSKVIAAQLEGAEIVRRKRDRLVWRREPESVEQLETLLHEYEERHQSDHDRLDAMMHYAQSRKCRTRFLTHYFDEDGDEDCGHCDNCLARAQGEPELKVAEPSSRTSSAASPHHLSPEELDRLVASAVGSTAAAEHLGSAAQDDTPLEPDPVVVAPAPFQLGQRVAHGSFGDGQVLAVELGKVSVEFAGEGVRDIDPRYLRPALAQD